MVQKFALSWNEEHIVYHESDELVFIVPNEELDNAKKIVHEEMTRRPSWAPDLPVTAEVGSGPSYGEAK